MVTITINGKQVQAEQGQMLIEAADNADIAIPRFCYHKNLSIAANCRMCLVEVEKAPKPVPACATPITDGMVVNTKSTKALAAQQAVMEFLLINHPLDCPICDQGGECDLQEFSVGYGKDKSDYHEVKRVVKDKNIGPLIATELTRCIHCTRCVRFGQEIAGMREMGATGRGDWMEIATYIEKSIDSELSGNIIDLCPVGALTSKVSRFTYRVWELASNDFVAAHDCIGSNINVQTKNGVIKRVIARENNAINDTWISDRDRYSFEGINSADRLTSPMIKQNGQWQEASWDDALQFAVNGLKAISDASDLGAVCSPSATTEEMFLLQKLMRGIGSNNIDHRLRQTDFSAQDADPRFPGLGMKLAEVKNLNAALLIGSNVRKEQPIMGHHLRQASLNGAQIAVMNPVKYEQIFKLAQEFITAPSRMIDELKSLAKAALEITGKKAPKGLTALVSGQTVNDEHKACIENLNQADNAAVIIGTMLQAMPDYASMRMLAGFIADATDSVLSYLTPGANTSGAYLSGLLPNRNAAGESGNGLDTQAMFAQPRKGYILFGIEPDRDIENPVQVQKALDNADFVVAVSMYQSDLLQNSADVLLPLSAISESSGTLINVDGTWQSFQAANKAIGRSKPGWKILRVMGNLFDVSGFDYQSSDEVLADVKTVAGDAVTDKAGNKLSWQCPDKSTAETALQRIAELPIYTLDAVVRRAEALQKTADAQVNCARINSATAEKLKIEDGQTVSAVQDGHSVDINISIDDRIADNCVYVPAGIESATALGGGYNAIELKAK